MCGFCISSKTMKNLKKMNAVNMMNREFSKMHGSSRHGFNQKPTVNQDVVDAVHYAMKKSHPDNGGNAEDFIRFKKCYENLNRW